MLAVVAIIAILTAVLLPVLSRARAKSYQATCTSNLRQIYVAYTLYERDWNGQFPPWHNLWTTATMAVPEYRADLLHAALNTYAGSRDIWYCKTAVYKRQPVVWCGIDQRYTGYVLPRVRWHHRLRRIAGSPYQTAEQVPLAGDPPGVPGRDTPGLEYTGAPHFEGSVIVYADGHAKWRPGFFQWQALYP
jgi:type II secretory pathway pseudopilin PulG